MLKLVELLDKMELGGCRMGRLVGRVFQSDPRINITARKRGALEEDITVAHKAYTCA